MRKEIFTPALIKEPMGIIFFWINAFYCGLGTCISSCMDDRNKNSKFNGGHFIMGILQCILCPCCVGYCLSVAWGTCMYLKGRGFINKEWSLGKESSPTNT